MQLPYIARVNAGYSIESLERRLLLTAGLTPVANLPDATMPGFMVNQVVPTASKYFFIGSDFDGLERLYASTSNESSVLLATGGLSPSQGYEFGISAPTIFNNKLYYFANGAPQDGFYVTDGTPTGTSGVRLRATGSGVIPDTIQILNGKMYYLELAPTPQLIASDGTPGGTSSIYTFSSVIEGAHKLLTVVDGKLLLQADQKLFMSDGTAAGTLPVPGISFTSSQAILSFAVTASKVFMVIKDSARGLYVMNRDFTQFAPVDVPGDAGVGFDPTTLRVIGDKCIFVGGPNYTLYASNGLATAQRLLTSSSTNFYLQGFVQLPGRVAFVRNDIARSLWVTDGTVAGTIQLRQLGTPQVEAGFAGDGEHAYVADTIAAHGTRIVITDGTVAGTREILSTGFDTGHYFQQFGSYNGQLIVAGGPALISNFDTNFPTGTISGTAFTDFNRNGTSEGFEGVIGGTVYLDLNRNGASDSADLILNVDNTFSFVNLLADQYVVRYETGNSITFSYPANGYHLVDLTANPVANNTNFTNTPIHTVVWGKVFNDINRNGVQEVGEGGLQGQAIYLDADGNGLLNGTELQSISAADGTFALIDPTAFAFNLRRNDKPGFHQTLPVDRGGYTVSVGSGAVVRAPDFGSVAVPAVTLRGNFWNDWNQNGARDSGDTFLSNSQARVYVDYNNSGTFDAGEPSVTLNPGVNFLLSNLPGELLTVRSTFPANYVYTSPASQAAIIDARSGGTFRTPDAFVFDTTATPPPGKITGIVWMDTNSNGIKDPDESGIPDRLVWLDADTVGFRAFYERFAITDANGIYQFPTTPLGTHKINVQLDDGWQSTSPPSRTVTITSTALNVAADFGVISNDTTGPEMYGAAFNYLTGGTTFTMSFSENVNFPALTSANFAVLNLVTSEFIPQEDVLVSYDAGSDLATLSFAGGIIPNGEYQVTASGLTDFAGNAAIGSLVIGPNFFQQADANRDRAVDTLDFNLLAGNFGGTSKVFSQGNFDYDPVGNVNSIDFNIFCLQYGRSLPSEAPPVPLASISAVQSAGPIPQLFSAANIDEDARLDELT